MSEMKRQKTKDKKIIIAVIGCIFVVAVILVLFYKPIYYRLYWGDRIQGTIKLIIDDEQVSLQENDILINGESKIVINSDGTAFISFHGGEYGDYGFYVVNSLIDKTIQINCFQHNWWNVQTFDLTLSAYTSAGTLTFGGDYTTISDNFDILKEKILTTIDISDDLITYTIGM
jgi:hypothetical protein